MNEISKAAAALGKKGGAVKSDKKAAAVRENGKKGGRPRKQLETTEPLTIEHSQGLVWEIQGKDTGTIYGRGESVGLLRQLMARTHQPPRAGQKDPGVWHLK